MAENFGIRQDFAFPALAVHAPLNDNVFLYQEGEIIKVDVVEDMLVTILQGKARRGQVFGSEATEIKVDATEFGKHTEL